MFEPNLADPSILAVCGSPKLGVLVPRDRSECLDLVSPILASLLCVVPQNWGFAFYGSETGPRPFPQNLEFPSMDAVGAFFLQAAWRYFSEKRHKHRPTKDLWASSRASTNWSFSVLYFGHHRTTLFS